MTPDERDALMALAEQATPGEWTVKPIGNSIACNVHTDHFHGIVAQIMLPQDAAYIAAASPETVRALLAENERLRAEKARLERIIENTAAEAVKLDSDPLAFSKRIYMTLAGLLPMDTPDA